MEAAQAEERKFWERLRWKCGACEVLGACAFAAALALKVAQAAFLERALWVVRARAE